MTPERKAARGTKRTCQNETCGLHFYDLNRKIIGCPVCGSGFVIPVVVAPPQPTFRRFIDRRAMRAEKVEHVEAEVSKPQVANEGAGTDDAAVPLLDAEEEEAFEIEDGADEKGD